jgi:hypothetical protein
MRMRHQPTNEEQLTRLADDTLAAPQRGALLRDVADSPEFAAALAEQTYAVGLVRSVEVEAPATLHARVGALQRPLAQRVRWQLAVPSSIVAAAAVVALVFALTPSSTPVTVVGAAHLALSSATLGAPPATTGDPTTVTTAIDGVSFPDWQARGWQTTGARRDTLGGQDVDTVFYSSASYPSVGYSIAAGDPLSVGSVQQAVLIHGVRFEVIDADGATIVTWLRDGHTCVLAARDADADVLLSLASWTQHSSVA